MIDNFLLYKNAGRYVEKVLFETEDRIIYDNTTITLDYSIEDFDTLQFILRSSIEASGARDTAAFTIAVSEAIENYGNPNKPFTFYSKDISGYEMYIHGYFADDTHFTVTTTSGCAINKILGMTTQHVDDPELETDTVYLNGSAILQWKNLIENEDAPAFLPVFKKNGKLVCYDFPDDDGSSLYETYFEEEQQLRGVSEDNVGMKERTMQLSVGEFKNAATEIPTNDARYPVYVYEGIFYYCEKTLGFSNNTNFESIMNMAQTVCKQDADYRIHLDEEFGYSIYKDVKTGDPSYGVISFRYWDTSKVTNMTEAFSTTKGLYWIDVTGWDVSNVTNMTRMFAGLRMAADVFGLEDWDVSKVENMTGMFEDFGNDYDYLKATGWSVDEYSMYGTRVMDYIWHLKHYSEPPGTRPTCLSQIDLSNWNPASLRIADRMFCKSNVHIPLTWNTPRLESMSESFRQPRSLMYHTGFDDYGYYVASEAYGDLTLRWNTSNVSDMSGLFKYADSVFDLSELDTRAVTNMSSMFEGVNRDINDSASCDAFFSRDSIEGLDVSTVTNMSKMFKDSLLCHTFEEDGRQSQVLDLSTWNTARATDMSSMFEWERNIPYDPLAPQVDDRDGNWYNHDRQGVFGVDISTFNTMRVQNFNRMFYTYDLITEEEGKEVDVPEIQVGGDVSTWNTTSATNMSYMFYNGVAKGYTNFTTDFVTDMSYMFYKADIRGNLANGLRETVEDWNTNNVTNFSHMFEESYFIPGVDHFRVDNAPNGNIYHMFYNCDWGVYDVDTMTRSISNYEQNYIFDFSNWDVSAQTSLEGMFSFRPYYEILNHYMDMSEYDFDTRPNPNITGKMIGFENWDTSLVTSIEKFFYWCPINIGTFDLTAWDITNIDDVSGMFEHCVAEKIIIPPDLLYAHTVRLRYENTIPHEYEDFVSGYYLYPFDFCGADTIQLDNLVVENVDLTDGGMFAVKLFIFGNLYDSSHPATSPSRFTEMIARNWDIGDEDLDNFFNYSLIRKVNLSNWDVSEVGYFSNMFKNERCYSDSVQGVIFDQSVGGVTDFSSLDNWNPDFANVETAGFYGMCNTNLQGNEVLAQQDGYHYGQQGIRFPNWADGRWIFDQLGYYHSFRNQAPNGDYYDCYTFNEHDTFDGRGETETGTFVPNLLDHIEARFDIEAMGYYKEVLPTTPLDDLKQATIVDGYYLNGGYDSYIIPDTDYTLSGTLQLGDSTITVSTQDISGQTFTDTITVPVTDLTTSITATVNQTGLIYTDTVVANGFRELSPDIEQYITVTGHTTSGASYTVQNTVYIQDEYYPYTLVAGANAIPICIEDEHRVKEPKTTVTIIATKTPTSLSAQFVQGSAVVTPITPLNDLKQYLTVGVTYDDSTVATLTANDYTLSGTLAVGTSTVTVSYTAPERTEAITTTFTVTVTPISQTLLNNWDFTTGSVMDTVRGDAANDGRISCETNKGIILDTRMGYYAAIDPDMSYIDLEDGYSVALEYDIDPYTIASGGYGADGYDMTCFDSTNIGNTTFIIDDNGYRYDFGGTSIQLSIFPNTTSTIREEYIWTDSTHMLCRSYLIDSNSQSTLLHQYTVTNPDVRGFVGWYDSFSYTDGEMHLKATRIYRINTSS